MGKTFSFFLNLGTFCRMLNSFIYSFKILNLKGDIGAFDFFRQETSNADVVVRSEAMSKLLIIAALMSPDKVRSEMIPYLICK